MRQWPPNVVGRWVGSKADGAGGEFHADCPLRRVLRLWGATDTELLPAHVLVRMVERSKLLHKIVNRF